MNRNPLHRVGHEHYVIEILAGVTIQVFAEAVAVRVRGVQSCRVNGVEKVDHTIFQRLMVYGSGIIPGSLILRTR